ncbi:hypothetical protein GOBAR_DD25659 [Gossypium barbadense]|nr:hypothetical protein GOBAR_DD25659 [Gossypium barbadense]
MYLEEHIFPRLGKTFLALYVHIGVQRSENFPGISALRWINEAIPINVWDNLQTVYFLNPGLQPHLLLATFGHFLLSGGVAMVLEGDREEQSSAVVSGAASAARVCFEKEGRKNDRKRDEKKRTFLIKKKRYRET